MLLGIIQNLSDLHAQVAACHRGVILINNLINEQSFEVVDFYMHAIMFTAERAVRDLLKHIHKKFGGESLQAVDWLDDGTRLSLKLDINPDDGSVVFDFTGTSPQMYVNCNPTSSPSCLLRLLATSSCRLNGKEYF